MSFLTTSTSQSINGWKANSSIFGDVWQTQYSYSGLGLSSAISADGNTVVAGYSPGGVGGSTNYGYYIFTRNIDTWSVNAMFPSYQDSLTGWSVDIDSTGSTVIVGAPGVSKYTGQIVILSRNIDNTWNQYIMNGITWVGSTSYGFGSQVKISSDGNTIAVTGSPTSGIWKIYVYVKSGITWSLQYTIDNVNSLSLLDLVETGNTIILSNGKIYRRTGFTWAYSEAPVTAATAMSEDGNTIINSTASSFTGVKKVLGVWTAFAGASYTLFADPYYTSISSDGSKMIIGNLYKTFVFTLDNSSWYNTATLTPKYGEGKSGMLSDDASTIVLTTKNMTGGQVTYMYKNIG